MSQMKMNSLCTKPCDAIAKKLKAFKIGNTSYAENVQIQARGIIGSRSSSTYNESFFINDLQEGNTMLTTVQQIDEELERLTAMKLKLLKPKLYWVSDTDDRPSRTKESTCSRGLVIDGVYQTAADHNVKWKYFTPLTHAEWLELEPQRTSRYNWKEIMKAYPNAFYATTDKDGTVCYWSNSATLKYFNDCKWVGGELWLNRNDTYVFDNVTRCNDSLYSLEINPYLKESL